MTDCSKFNKPQFVTQVISQLQQELENTESAAQQAHEGATHEQSKAETQYDTLGLEHAYLAEGQSRRIEELRQAILQLEHMGLPQLSEDDAIVLGTLIKIENHSNPSTQLVFMAVNGGGVKQQTDLGEITVITPQSPLGEELLGRYLDDEFKWPNGADGLIIDLA